MKKQIRLILFLLIIKVDCHANIKFPVIDFDTALGKNESIMFKGKPCCLFNDCLYVRPGIYSNNWDLAARPKTALDLYIFFKYLYEKSAPWLIKPIENYKIPPHIHQIWIQGKIPERFKAWQKSWQNIPGWSYTLWADKEIRALGLKNQVLYDQAAAKKQYAKQSDIARIEILYRFGGVYVDTDCQCLKPDSFDWFNRYYTFYIGIQPLDTTILVLANGIIGAAPGHPILKKYVDTLMQTYNPNTGVHISTGPVALTKAFRESAGQEDYTDIAVPPTYFYPKTDCANWYLPKSTDCRHDAKEESMAVHYWHAYNETATLNNL